MVPSFNETDLVVEWQSPPGTSLQRDGGPPRTSFATSSRIARCRRRLRYFGRALLCNCGRATDVNAFRQV